MSHTTSSQTGYYHLLGRNSNSNSNSNTRPESELTFDENDDLYPSPASASEMKEYTDDLLSAIADNPSSAAVASSSKNNARQRLAETRRQRRKNKKTAKQMEKMRRKQLRNHWVKGTPQALDAHYVDMLEKSLVRFFRSGYERYWNDGQKETDDAVILKTIKQLMKQYRFIISGGFILKNTGLSNPDDEYRPSVDIDIYVPNNTPSRHPDFYDTMAKLFHCDQTPSGDWHVDRFIAGVGSKSSFFKKNHIYSVFKHKRITEDGYAEMDLVRADPQTTPTKIVKNFDLSVCMNWYDGETIYAMDPPAIFRQDTGYLNYSYLVLLFGGINNHGTEHPPNSATRSRVLKYLHRGYRISYVDPKTGGIVEIVPADLM